MKTAISLPDGLFDEAEHLAAKLGMSRSQLYASALAEFVAKHRASDVTAALDRVYAEVDARSESAPRHAVQRAVTRSEWA